MPAPRGAARRASLRVELDLQLATEILPANSCSAHVGRDHLPDLACVQKLAEPTPSMPALFETTVRPLTPRREAHRLDQLVRDAAEAEAAAHHHHGRRAGGRQGRGGIRVDLLHRTVLFPPDPTGRNLGSACPRACSPLRAREIQWCAGTGPRGRGRSVTALRWGGQGGPARARQTKPAKDAKLPTRRADPAGPRQPEGPARRPAPVTAAAPSSMMSLRRPILRPRSREPDRGGLGLRDWPLEDGRDGLRAPRLRRPTAWA